MKRFMVAAVLLGLMGTFASAGLIAIGHAEGVDKTDLPAGYVVNQLIIDVPAGDIFLSAELLVFLTGVDTPIYQNADGMNYPPPWTSSLMRPQTTPPPPQTPPTALSWDTYVSGGSLSWCSWYNPDDEVGVGATGYSCSIINGAVDIGGDIVPTFDNHKIDVCWMAGPDVTGRLTIAQITLKNLSQGQWCLRVGFGSNRPGDQHFAILAGFPIRDGRLDPWPEPSTWVLMLCGGLSLLAFGRRR